MRTNFFSKHSKYPHETHTRMGWLWLLPFFSFAAGYLMIAQFFGTTPIQAPSLIGRSLQEAARELSALNLNLRIVTEKLDTELQPNTIITQAPIAGTVIKENQSIFIVTSKKPPLPEAPDCVKKTISEAQKEVESAGVQAKWHYLNSPYPENQCFAQYPAAGSELAKPLVVYISAGEKKPVLWPAFSGKSTDRVVPFLESHNIPVQIIHAQKANKPEAQPPFADSSPQEIIIDQRPLAGSIVSIEPTKIPRVQLQVKTINS